jgi:putative phosphoribosyl transferase
VASSHSRFRSSTDGTRRAFGLPWWPMLLTVHQYRDRVEAGQVLAQQLLRYTHRLDTLVLGLAPGGVPVAFQVATELNAPLDVFCVRNLAAPGSPHLIMGAIASGGARVNDELAVREAGITPQDLEAVTARELAELNRCEKLYRGNRRPASIAGRVVIVVDDGVATGYSMHAAVIALHQLQPAWLVVATPVAPPEFCEEIVDEVHDLVCPLRPDTFQAADLWYEYFAPATDEDIRVCLHRAKSLPRI